MGTSIYNVTSNLSLLKIDFSVILMQAGLGSPRSYADAADPSTPSIVAPLIVLLNSFFATIIIRIVTRKGASIVAFKRCVGAARTD